MNQLKDQDNTLSMMHSWICFPKVVHIPNILISHQDHVLCLRTASPAWLQEAFHNQWLLGDCPPVIDIERPARLCAEF